MLICAVVPVYNHGDAVGSVVAALRAQGLPCVLVDDGSDDYCAGVLDALATGDGQVHLVRLAVNSGKGGAMIAGLRAAQKLGFSHALQIDADGQHDSADIPRFLERARHQPDALICGCPLYDADAPKSRRYGRYATHVWVWINTLSLDIADAMCGFRVYPLATTVPLFDQVKLGLRMDFDVEVLVRLSWRGMRIVNQPTRVSYPLDGVSHFQLWRDNLRISRMHAKLFFGMLPRLPLLLARKALR
ncbi:glycosyl transferase [Chromobacterium violaceum]|uniref:glycosyltransferase family 2 protein n=1 Tax=Chromobacterium violaceum TaxID=536 RepID=UPI0006533242|nr:glycosyltransferase family 2 protein [Chromobacterium violaceum]KMN49128.1 glycosyl transferase [Chromobacterium violaceum]KMN84802.1 glycosyl transferase [Chromobacterium violaceum]KMN88265.1 glycosyl transferase [Chromobacterium violaceum]KMO02199.1 glycosyl transferase [Chromobacterium violaceum]